MDKPFFLVILQLLLLPLSSCSKTYPVVAQDNHVLHAGGGNALAIVFLEGKPTADGDLLQSLDYEAGAGDVLFENLELIKSAPAAIFQVTGWTDDVECEGKGSCVALSLRRALLVTRWYKEQGASNLAPPEGGGQYLALPIKPTELDRRIARRAELKVN